MRGVYLKGGLSLYQYAPFTDCIYLFIYFFPEEKKKVRVDVWVRVCTRECLLVYSIQLILSLDSKLR